MTIPFTKAHGARNDFLLTWREQLPSSITDLTSAARALCDRHTGAGADGWLLMSEAPDAESADVAIELWNSDGSRSEMSGNGTRCAAALLSYSRHNGRPWQRLPIRARRPRPPVALPIESGSPGIIPGEKEGPGTGATDIRGVIRIATGAGIKHLRLLERHGRKFSFEMNMGPAIIEELRTTLNGCDATILNTGNPQCAVFVENFDLDWRGMGAALEWAPRFPNRTNVSFIRVLDEHTLEVRFFERGAGETMSSGTGSTGAGAAAVARGLARSPVDVLTPAGPLKLRWEGDDILLAGPAEIVASGEFYLEAHSAGRARW